MEFNKQLYKNKYRVTTTRLPHYDYASANMYTVTIVTQKAIAFFGEIHKEFMCYTSIGGIAYRCWCAIPMHFPWVELDVFTIMPNHIHGLLRIKHKPEITGVETQDLASLQPPINDRSNEWQRNTFGPQSRNLASIVRGYKIGVTKEARKYDQQFAWQSRYYDSVMKDEMHIYNTREYITNNILKWDEDEMKTKNKQII